MREGGRYPWERLQGLRGVIISSLLPFLSSRTISTIAGLYDVCECLGDLRQAKVQWVPTRLALVGARRALAAAEQFGSADVVSELPTWQET